MRLASSLRVGVATLLVWALVAGSAVFWLLRLGGGQLPIDVPVAGSRTAGGPAVDPRLVARALGAEGDTTGTPAPAEVTSRLRLLGVVTHEGRGAALIAVDGKPARPVRVGATVPGLDGDWTVRGVTPHAALLMSDGREARLEMPPLDQRSRAGDVVASPTRPAAATPGGPIGRIPTLGVQTPQAHPVR